MKRSKPSKRGRRQQHQQQNTRQPNQYQAFYPSHARGTLRSGKEFSAKNTPRYKSYAELLKHHENLLKKEPRIATDELGISNLSGDRLLSSQITFRADHPSISTDLQNFFRPFFEYGESAASGFEVVVTFNAVLYNKVRLGLVFLIN